MIVKFKLFENINEPEIGDYVICTCDSGDKDIDNFTKSHIGRIVDIHKDDELILLYVVHYEDKVRLGNLMYPFFSKLTFCFNSTFDPEFLREEIVYFGTYNEMEIILTSQKYNL
jgi:hypothetical protein